MPAEPVTLARHAMATRFEIVLHGDNPVALRAGGEAALDEIERLENLLSLYRSSTEIAHVNARGGYEPVRVSVPIFRLIQHALQLSEETKGAFDITIGPLMRCWGFMAESGRVPEATELAAARALVGSRLVELNPADFTVRFLRPGMMIDLGAIGKGYAIDCAVDVLREAGIASALIHGGTSSIYGLGHPPGEPAWKVALRGQEAGGRGQEAGGGRQEAGRERGWRGKVHLAEPKDAECGGTSTVASREAAGKAPGSEEQLPNISLCNGALSVSAVWGKSFQTADKRYGHVIDPRTGEPAGDALLAAVALPSTTETDALSTALLTVGTPGMSEIVRLRPRATCVVLTDAPEG